MARGGWSLHSRYQSPSHGELGDEGAKLLQPFTKNVREAKKSLEKLTAFGGGDAPEAVLGGLDVAVATVAASVLFTSYHALTIGALAPGPAGAAVMLAAKPLRL